MKKNIQNITTDNTTHLGAMSAQVEVGPVWGLILVTVAGGERDSHNALGVPAGEPALAVVLAARGATWGGYSVPCPTAGRVGHLPHP